MLTFGISSELCMIGNDVVSDPDAVPPPSSEHLNKIQRINKVTTALENKFGDKFIIKSESSFNKRHCQFRGGGDIFILHRAQPLGAVLLTDEYISSKLEFEEAFEGEIRGGAIEQNVMSNKSESDLTS